MILCNTCTDEQVFSFESECIRYFLHLFHRMG